MKRGHTCEHKFSECTGRQGQDGGVSAAGGTERSGVRRERRGPGGFESGQGAAQHGWNRYGASSREPRMERHAVSAAGHRTN